MKPIDEARLETDLAYRFEYLADFVGFGPSDAAEVQACAAILGPQIPQIVEKTYAKLLSFEATARHFIPRQSGYTGPTPAGLNGLNQNDPQIRFRKEHLSRYLMQVLGRTCDAKLAPYLDMVGKIHTPQAGNSEIDVPLVQMNALMGYLSDAVFEILLSAQMDASSMSRALRAMNKLLWIQNDFITRHYGGSLAAASCGAPA